MRSLRSSHIHIGSPWPDQRGTRFWHLWSGHPRREPNSSPTRIPADCAGMTSSLIPLPLRKRPVVQPPVEPILVTSDVLLHRDVDVRLEQRNAGHVRESSI